MSFFFPAAINAFKFVLCISFSLSLFLFWFLSGTIPQRENRITNNTQTNAKKKKQIFLARQNRSIVSNDVDASLHNGRWIYRWWKNCHHKHTHKSTMPFGNTDQVHGAQSKSTFVYFDSWRCPDLPTEWHNIESEEQGIVKSMRAFVACKMFNWHFVWQTYLLFQRITCKAHPFSVSISSAGCVVSFWIKLRTKQQRTDDGAQNNGKWSKT